MAKDKKTQASAIRDALDELGVEASALDVAAYVDEHHPEIGLGKKANYSAMVSVERAKKRGGPKKKKRGRPRKTDNATAKSNNTGAASGDPLQSAVKFVKQCGTIKEAKKQIERLEEISKLR